MKKRNNLHNYYFDMYIMILQEKEKHSQLNLVFDKCLNDEWL